MFVCEDLETQTVSSESGFIHHMIKNYKFQKHGIVPINSERYDRDYVVNFIKDNALNINTQQNITKHSFQINLNITNTVGIAIYNIKKDVWIDSVSDILTLNESDYQSNSAESVIFNCLVHLDSRSQNWCKNQNFGYLVLGSNDNIIGTLKIKTYSFELGNNLSLIVMFGASYVGGLQIIAQNNSI